MVSFIGLQRMNPLVSLFQGDLKQFLRISKSKDEKIKPQPISTKTKASTKHNGILTNTH